MRVLLPTAGTIDLSVFDERGRRVASVFSGDRSAGEWAFHWDGRDAKGRSAASGFYFLRLRSGGVQDNRRIVLQH
jgi:flagellar hook assembly protein FlgD